MAKIKAASFNVDRNLALTQKNQKKIAEIDHFSKAFEKELNESLFTRDNVFYNTKPASPQPGDVYWRTEDVFGNPDGKGEASRYDGVNWNPVKTVQNLYGTNMYGVDVHGDRIVGGVFRNEDSSFTIDTSGTIKGFNYKMDITSTEGDRGHVPRRYSNGADGFSLDEGYMHFEADETFDNGGSYWANAYLGADDLKLRRYATNDHSSGGLLGRVDFRGSKGEFRNDFGDHFGADSNSHGVTITGNGDGTIYANNLRLRGSLSGGSSSDTNAHLNNLINSLESRVNQLESKIRQLENDTSNIRQHPVRWGHLFTNKIKWG